MSPALRVAFWTHAGEQIGFGHVWRCLALAAALRREGAESLFLLDGPSTVANRVRVAGFSVTAVHHRDGVGTWLAWARRQGARAFITDSYLLRCEDLDGLAGGNAVLVAITDLAHALPVDLLVNSGVTAGPAPYPDAIRTVQLLGPRYCLLAPEFAEDPVGGTLGPVKRVLITTGGGDPCGLAVRLVRATAQALPGCHLDVVVGPLDRGSELEALAQSSASQLTVHHAPQDMRRLMLAADLAVCAGGQTTYELAASATPAVAVSMADNQTGNLQGLAAAGTLVWAGNATDEDLEPKVTQAVLALAADAAWREEMGRRGRRLVDGRGAERVARTILDLIPAPV